MTDRHERHPDEPLQSVNAALATLLRMTPASLELGADVALRDELVVCGLLGGKEVGKSTLIDALAGTKVARSPKPVGEGTTRPLAYVHEDARETVTQRLREINRLMPVDLWPHRADALRNVVLVDLPDFDSQFAEHEQIVRSVARLLDRVVWVLTPRKIGDRDWVRMVHRVIKDTRNVYCVLNKLDELMTDGEGPAGGNGQGAEAFWVRQRQWMDASLRSAGCDEATQSRFLVSAGFPTADRFVSRVAQLWDDPAWQRYSSDRQAVTQVAGLAVADLERLRASVLAPLGTEQARGIKLANLRCERAEAVERIRRHYDLDRVRERLSAACDEAYYRAVLAQSLGEGAAAEIAEGLEAGVRRDAELADELLERRVEDWPLLRIVYWPFGWLSRSVGRRLTPRGAGARPEAGDGPRGLDVEAFAARVQELRARVMADHVLTVNRFEMEWEMPEGQVLARGAQRGIGALADQLETRLIESIRARDRRPSFLARLALWGVLLWFPLVQPVAEGVLQLLSAGGVIETVGGLYHVVAALGATRLLAGLGMVAVVYVVVLAAMYVRALRAVRAARSLQDVESPWIEAVDATLMSAVVEPLAAPFRTRHRELDALCERLRSLSEPRP